MLEAHSARKEALMPRWSVARTGHSSLAFAAVPWRGSEAGTANRNMDGAMKLSFAGAGAPSWSRRRTGLPVLVTLVLLLLALLIGSAQAQAPAPTTAPPPDARMRVETLRLDVQQIETTLGSRELSDADLQRLRQRADPLLDTLRGLADDLGQKADQARARLEQLGPKPDAKAPAESSEIANERALREKALADADELSRLARAMMLQTEQVMSSIADKRRALFARTLFQHGPTLLNPGLWISLLSSLPQDLRALNLLAEDWLSSVFARLGDRAVFPLVLSLFAAAGLYLARLRYLPLVMAKLGSDADATRIKRLVAAVVRLVAGALPAVLGSWLVYTALLNAGMVPRRVEPFAWAVLSGLAFLAFIGAMSDATVAPKWPQRRIFGVSDRNARIIKQLVGSTALVLVAGKMVEALLQSIAAGLSLSIVARAAFALLFAGVLAFHLNQLRDSGAEEEHPGLGPYVPVDGALLAPLRLVGWFLVVAIGGATLFGYVALASFMVDQSAWILVILTLAALALMLADEGLHALLAGDGRISMMLQTNIGLRKRALEQAAVLGAGVTKLILIIIAAMLILAPWGIESADLTSSIKAAFFGFKVGDVTISLSSIIVAGLLLVVGLTATKALTRWLDERFLPATDLDTGLRNSLKTMAGYIGFIAALALAISSLGLSLERLTIVAGALSVGIGFGLQSVVSNFVSGLILLWERPIRVGDLIVVGDGEGVVRRINVRSTEIETFDRSTVIVPNSNLITGVVKNRVRSDRTGRVIVSLSAPRSASPEQVRDVMLAAADRHPHVLKEPKPRVLFKKISETALDFDLICIVPEVDLVGVVSSDLHFEIFGDLSREGIGQPEREVAVKGLDRIEDTLDELVDTLEEAQEAQTAALQARRKPATAAQPKPVAAPPARQGKPSPAARAKPKNPEESI
jgi:potassium-dependent mechanosensitive channel